MGSEQSVTNQSPSSLIQEPFENGNENFTDWLDMSESTDRREFELNFNGDMPEYMPLKRDAVRKIHHDFHLLVHSARHAKHSKSILCASKNAVTLVVAFIPGVGWKIKNGLSLGASIADKTFADPEHMMKEASELFRVMLAMKRAYVSQAAACSSIGFTCCCSETYSGFRRRYDTTMDTVWSGAFNAYAELDAMPSVFDHP